MATGALGRQKEELVERLRRPRLQQGEQGRDRLADAGGCLSHQATAGDGRAIDRLRQDALSRAKRRVRKRQRTQGVLAPVGVCRFLPAPRQIPIALHFEEGAQVGSRMPFAEDRLTLARDLEIDECNLDGAEAEPLAQQPAIHLGLRPVKDAVVRRHSVQRTAVRLDFVDATRCGVIAVRPATHAETAMFAAQGHFGRIALGAPSSDDGVAGDALLGRWRRREALVEIARFRGELAQGPNADRVVRRRRFDRHRRCSRRYSL